MTSFRNISGTLPSLVFVWLVIVSSLPFTFIAVPPIDYRLIGTALTVLFSVPLLVRITLNRWIFLPSPIICGLVSLQVFSFALLSLWHVDLDYWLVTNGQIIVSFFLFAVIKTVIGTGRFAISYCYVFAFLSVLSIVSFLCALSGIIKPFFYANPDGRIAAHYIFGTSNVNWSIGDGFFIRVASYMDEPGQFAVFLSFAFILNRLYRNDSLFTWLYTLAGCLTFSLYFFAFIALYFGSSVNLKSFLFPRRAVIKQFSLIISATLMLGFVISSIDKDQRFINRTASATLDRLEHAEEDDRLFAGDNRTEHLSTALDVWEQAPYFGVGRAISNDPSHRLYGTKIGANLFRPAAQSGALGFIANFALPLAILFLGFLSLRQNHTLCWRNALIVSGAVVMIALHRPIVTMVLMSLVFYILLENYVSDLVGLGKRRGRSIKRPWRL